MHYKIAAKDSKIARVDSKLVRFIEPEGMKT